MLKGSEEAATPLKDALPHHLQKGGGGGGDRLVISNLAQKPVLTPDMPIS